MAKISGPLFSQSAHGSIGAQLNYQRQVSGQIVRRHSAPTGAPSAIQTQRRAHYSAGIAAWHSLTPAEKTAWAQIGLTSAITGYNAFLSAWLTGSQPVPGTVWDNGETLWDSGSTVWDN